MVRAGAELSREVRDAHAQIELLMCDLADGPRLDAIVQKVAPNEIYNLVGMTSVALTWLEPALVGTVNGVAVAHPLEAAGFRHSQDHPSGGPNRPRWQRQDHARQP